MKLPLIFAHRGANSFAPENSLAAFKKALDLGCDGIEFDIRFTADQEVVVFHDRTATRLTGTHKNIGKLTLTQIRALKFLNPQFEQERIPTFHEVLKLIPADKKIIIDIKKESLVRNIFEEKILSIIAGTAHSENIIISSFNPLVLKKIAALNPEIHLGLIYQTKSGLLMANGQRLQSLHVRHQSLSRRHLAHIRKKAKFVYAWTVDKERDMFSNIEKGVDGIISNRPELFLQIKAEIER